jgi:erythromycin esterase-like protein
VRIRCRGDRGRLAGCPRLNRYVAGAGDASIDDAFSDFQRFPAWMWLRANGRQGRIVVWAHNSHLGDARATQMGQRGEWNVGQLLREQAGPANTLSIGFTTYTGHVTAARDWDHPAERRWIRPARKDSYENLLHGTRLDRFFLSLQDGAAPALAEPLLERAIGVVYRPESELESHYFRASLGAQFDGLFHLDETTAVEPFDITEHWTLHEPPDTYPFGL